MPVCAICDGAAEHQVQELLTTFSCPRCGSYQGSRASGWLPVETPAHRVRLSGWVREHNASGVVPLITPDVSRRVEAMKLPGLRDRASRVLAVLARDYLRPGATIVPNTAKQDLELLGVSYSRNEHEIDLLFSVLKDEGFLREMGTMSAISVKGMLAAEALGASKSNSAQGFVAMWFDPSLQDAWINGFDPGIRVAGFRPFRIDAKDYLGGITDEIMAEIRRSRFVVVDYTGHRKSVYFEAGFAAGLGLTVIQTCRADEIDKLHFDIRHLHTLPWKSPDELAEGLNRRIRAAIGAGPDADPP